MAKRLLKWLAWAAAGLLVIVIGIVILVRSLVTPDLVKASLESQATQVLGTPVTIGTLDFAWYPRVGLRLHDVNIGQPRQLAVGELQISAGLRGVLRRRVDDAELIVRRSQVDVRSLVALAAKAAAGSGGPASGTGSASFEIASVRTIRLDGVTLQAGSHTIVASAEAALKGTTLTIQSLSAKAPGTALSASGTVGLEPVSASFRIEADELAVDELMAFMSEATSGSSSTGSSPSSGSSAAGAHITADITAKRGLLSGLQFADLTTHAVVDDTSARLDPLKVTLFGGRLDGRVTHLSGSGPARVSLAGSLAGANASDVLAWVGQPRDTVTGHLGGSVRVSATGDATTPQAWRGTANLVLTDGTLKGLSAVREAVVALSGRQATSGTAASTHYERIGGVFALEGSHIRCSDLAIRSPDADLNGNGTIALPNGVVDVRAQIVLSQALSADAGRDLYRYAREGDRVVLPAVVKGPIGAPSVSIDLKDAATRALKNKAEEEATSFLNKLLKKKKP
jgi:uncharacterized protein YhdP